MYGMYIILGLLETLQANNQLLDQIMKCLEAYLESKRVVFPRFVLHSLLELKYLFILRCS